jgi:hypothetical protein
MAQVSVGLSFIPRPRDSCARSRTPSCPEHHIKDTRREAPASRLVVGDQKLTLRLQQISWNFASIFGDLFYDSRMQPDVHGG